MKPVMNLDEAVSDEIEDNGLYAARRGQISDLIGARKPGYNLTVLPPGRASVPATATMARRRCFSSWRAQENCAAARSASLFAGTA
jgi:hypothetical protein